MAKRAKSPQATKRIVNRVPRSGATVMNAATTVLGRTLVGAEDVGREVGATALAAVRGSMQAAGQIGGDLMEVTRAAVEGTISAAERIGTVATRAVRNIVSPDGAARRSAPRGTPRRRRAGLRRKATVSPKVVETRATA